MSSETRRTSLAAGFLGAALGGVLLWPVFFGMVPARGDLVDFFWPMKHYTASRWLAGEIALWNPLSGGGEPWLAQLQTGVFYPLDLAFFLPLPFSAFAGIVLHMAIASAGMAAWLYNLGTSRAAALAGGLLFCGGGAFLSLFPVYNNACTAAWLPWVFLGARLVSGGSNLAAFAVPAALSLLGGEPALAAFGGLASVVTAYWTRKEGDARLHAGANAGKRLLSASLLAIGITAVVLLPFIQLLVDSGRLVGATREEALSRPVGVVDLGDLLLPPSPEAVRTLIPGRGTYLLSLALGPAVFFLAVAGGAGFPGRGRLLAALAILGGIGLLLSLGAKGLLMPLLYDLGILRGLRFPARWFVFTHLGLAVFAAAGLDGWIYGNFETPTSRWTARGTVAFTGVLALGTLLSGGLIVGRDPWRGGAVVLALALMGGLIAAVRLLKWPLPAQASPVALLLVAIPLPFISRDPLELIRVELTRPHAGRDLKLSENRIFTALSDPNLLASFIRQDQQPWSAESVRRAVIGLAGYTNLWERIPSLNSASPIPNPRRTRLLGAALSGGDLASVLGLAGVQHLVTPMPLAGASLKLARSHRGVLRYDIPSPAGRAYFAASVKPASDDEVFSTILKEDLLKKDFAFLAAESGIGAASHRGRGYAAAKIVKDEAQELTVQTATSTESFLVITRSYDRGWSVSVDGQKRPLYRANLAFMGLFVPAGEHRVVLSYRPVSFIIGAAISAVSLMILFGLYLQGPGSQY
jgi:hypothetical protein